MNLARLFMLGNLSAEVILPDDLPNWLKSIPKAQRKEAWREYQRRLKTKEWEEYKQEESQKEAEIQLPPKLPEWIENLPAHLRKEAWGWHQHQLKRTRWGEIQRKAEEWKAIKERGKRFEESHPQPGPRPVRAGIDEEVQSAIKVYNVLDLIRNAWASHHYPEAVKEHIKDTLNEFANRSAKTAALLEEAELQSAEADNLDKAEKALNTLKAAKDSLEKADSLLQVFGPLFDEKTVENQRYTVRTLFEKFKNINTFVHTQKLRQSFQTIAPMQEVIRTASRRIIEGEVDPSVFSFLKSAADRISKTANSILTNPNANIQEQDKARETINLAESLKLLLNTAMAEFIQEVKSVTPQLSFPERFRQRKSAQLLSASAGALTEAHSRTGDREGRFDSMRQLVDSIDTILASRNLDPEVVPVLEESIKKSLPAIRWIASIQLSLPTVVDKDGRRIWRDEDEKIREEALSAFAALKTFVQSYKEGRFSSFRR